MKSLNSSLGLCAVLMASGAAQASLIDRGGGLIYDSDQNITWMQDANLAATNNFGVSGIYDPQYPVMGWSAAQKWIGAMNSGNYLGFHDWRLPTVSQTNATCTFQNGYYSYSCVGNELGSEIGHLFYSELGGVEGFDITATHNSAYALFQNIRSGRYWSSTVYGPSSSWYVWDFNLNTGRNGANFIGNQTDLAWAVIDGDVAAVPIPAASWLLMSGLLGLIGMARRNAA